MIDDKLLIEIPVVKNFIFNQKPNFEIKLQNTTEEVLQINLVLLIRSTYYNTQYGHEKTIYLLLLFDIILKSLENKIFFINLSKKFLPGFYEAVFLINNIEREVFCFGISPFNIKSDVKKPEGFNNFWKKIKKELDNINLCPKLLKLNFNSNLYDVYLVELNSLPDKLNGDPVIVRGYYFELNDGKKHPVVINYDGLDNILLQNCIKVEDELRNLENTNELGKRYSYFHFSVRGLNLNNSLKENRDDGVNKDFINIYGEWYRYNFGNKYYYLTGAYADGLLSIKFITTREATDLNNIYLSAACFGTSVCLAAAALTNYKISGIVSLLTPGWGRLSMCFKLYSWRGQFVNQERGNMSDKEVKLFLSYYDNIFFALKISCPILVGCCLDDTIAPPDIVLMIYNNLKSLNKLIIFYPKTSHKYPFDWNDLSLEFLNKLL